MALGLTSYLLSRPQNLIVWISTPSVSSPAHFSSPTTPSCKTLVLLAILSKSVLLILHAQIESAPSPTSFDTLYKHASNIDNINDIKVA